ncbi:MAG: ABC transporter ATP-binding protein [Gammaproteobacteria bacterium]|nr:ABC transporter ATP-binding protein [Gammaproteobacteria bacterium]
MVAYHVCAAADVPAALADGLPRSAGRRFLFEHWDDAQHLLAALPAQAGSDPRGAHAVLVLDVDEDMLQPAPIPARRLAPAVDAQLLARLQARSRYLETDLSRERIVDVKDALGNSIRARFERGGASRAPVWRFLAYIRPYWPYVAVATAAGIVKFLMPLVFPWMLRVLLDEVVLNTLPDGAVRSRRIVEIVALMLGANLVWMVAAYYRSVFAAIAGHRMIRDLRVALFDHVQRLSHSFFAHNQTGAIVSRVVNDMSLAQNFVGSALTNVWMDAVLLLVLIGILVSIDPALTAISLVLMPVYVVSLRTVGSRIRLTTREAQQRLEVLSGGLQEKVAGVVIVKGFTREPAETRAFTAQANKLLNKILYSIRFIALNEMLVGMVVHTSPVLVVWYGVNQILAGRLSIGELTQFLLYLAMFYFPLQRLSDLSVVLANALAAIDRIFEYFDTQPQVRERPAAITLAQCRGHIVFDHVAFSYDPNVTVLEDVCLEILPGETVAFVGPSGSGKSTLANLVPRFHDPGAGRILLDGHDLRDLSLASLRRHIGIVNQETVLFSGTVQENLLLAKPDATAAEIEAALVAANAADFVADLPEGLWTEIHERGTVLSGGQKQRLAIARAFLKNPRILILDEATSALDSRSERHIREALDRLLAARSAIVIAHRLTTVLNADRIVVIDAGRIVQIGTHASLVNAAGLYAQLYAEQFRHLHAGNAGD